MAINSETTGVDSFPKLKYSESNLQVWEIRIGLFPEIKGIKYSLVSCSKFPFKY